MPVARFQMPDGRIARFEVPDGTTPEQAQAMIQEHVGTPFNPADDMTTFQKVAAGAGKFLYDTARGAGQRLGMVSQQDIDEARRLDAPLMNTTAGKVGNVGGALAFTAPAMLVPGANTYAGAATTGAILGATQPTSGDESAAKNATIGAVTGPLAKFMTDKGVQVAQKWLTNRQATLAAQEASNATRDTTAAASRDAGYAIPGSMTNPGLVNTAIESIPGKQMMAQGASTQNQTITDQLARGALGLAPDAPLNSSVLAGIRQEAGKAYQAVKDFGSQYNLKIKSDPEFTKAVDNIKPDYSAAAREFPESSKNEAIDALMRDLAKGQWTPEAIIGKVKVLREAATANFRGDAKAVAEAQVQRDAAEALDALVERRLSQMGAGDLAQNYQNARVTIAKAHDVESALTAQDHIDARVLANINKRKGTLTDELETIANFGGSFKSAAQTPEGMGGAMTHAARPLAYGIAGAMMGDPTMGAITGAVVPYLAKSALLSKPMQAMATPSYNVNAFGRYTVPMLDSNLGRNALTVGGIEAGLYGAQ